MKISLMVLSDDNLMLVKVHSAIFKSYFTVKYYWLTANYRRKVLKNLKCQFVQVASTKYIFLRYKALTE